MDPGGLEGAPALQDQLGEEGSACVEELDLEVVFEDVVEGEEEAVEVDVEERGREL